MKTTVCLFVALLLIICVQSAHGQTWSGDLDNKDLPADQCPTYDSCSMAPGGGADPNAGGSASGMTSCTASRCLQCGNDVNTGTAACYYAVQGMNGSCQCSTKTFYDAVYRMYVTKCTGTGQCTYRG